MHCTSVFSQSQHRTGQLLPKKLPPPHNLLPANYAELLNKQGNRPQGDSTTQCLSFFIPRLLPDSATSLYKTRRRVNYDRISCFFSNCCTGRYVERVFMNYLVGLSLSLDVASIAAFWPVARRFVPWPFRNRACRTRRLLKGLTYVPRVRVSASVMIRC